jgi:dihydroorotate dehydrogenase
MLKLFYSLATRILHLLPAEIAHHLAIKTLRLFPARSVIADLDLNLFKQQLAGLDFPHPLGLAAGFDKDAEVFAQLGRLGFAFLEVGSVTPQPQPGNPLPRLFRLRAQQAIINRYGFNSRGMDYMARQFQHQRPTCITGINLGKNKATLDAAADFLQGAEKLADHAAYFAINVSSPNTPGLRDLQTPLMLEPIIAGVRNITRRISRRIPLFIKISPDMQVEQEAELVEFLLAKSIDGIIIGNTTLSRAGVENCAQAAEQGGLSGPPLRDRATAALRRIYKITQGRTLLIGCGGISSGADAYEKLRAGADLLQIYTAFVYQGPLIIRRILLELQALLIRDGVKNIRAIIGADNF